MIIGISSGHDASACIIDELGEIVYAIMEERITRLKHQSGFPINAVNRCFQIAKEKKEDIDAIIYAWDFGKNIRKKQLKEFKHYIKNPSYLIPNFISFLKRKESFKVYNEYMGVKCYYVEHHLAHAASVYFFSPFKKALNLVMDGRGEYQSMTLFDENLKKLEQILMPHSLGIFYSAITQLLGFKAGDGEYKIMGLASYGKPTCINEMKKLIDFDKGKLKMNLNYFYESPFFKHQLNKIIGSRKKLESTLYSRRLKKLLSKYNKKDIAHSAQKHLENILLEMFIYFKEKYNINKFNLSGGIFLNIVANKILIEKGFEIFVIPFAGDDGSSIGAAEYFLNKDNLNKKIKLDKLFWGDEYSNEEIEKILKKSKLKYKKYKDIGKEVAKLLKEEKIVGWFQGRDEFGPRALGNRSIISSPAKEEYRDKVNLAIKFREDWRPFCPSILFEDKKEYLSDAIEAPFMNLAFNANLKNSEKIPAVVHIDKTIRPQTTRKEQNKKYYKMINEFKKLSGTGVILNTSFNRNDEPIVHTPKNAIDCFLGTNMDALAVGDFLIIKEEKQYIKK